MFTEVQFSEKINLDPDCALDPKKDMSGKSGIINIPIDTRIPDFLSIYNQPNRKFADYQIFWV